MSLDAELLRDLLIQQLEPNAADLALAELAKEAWSVQDDNKHVDLEISFEGAEEERDYDRSLAAGNRTHEKTSEALREQLQATTTQAIDQLEERIEATLRLADEAELLEHWPGYAWLSALRDAHAGKSLIVPPSALDAYWRSLIRNMDPRHLSRGDTPVASTHGGDWGRVWHMIVRETRNAQGFSSARQRAWLDLWVELGQELIQQPQLTFETTWVTGYERKAGGDGRPRAIIVQEALEEARMMGLENPGSALHAWALDQAPNPLAPGDLAWGFYLDKCKKASTPYDRKLAQEQLEKTVAQSMDHHPDLWRAWAYQAAPEGLAPSTDNAWTRLENWRKIHQQSPSLDVVAQAAHDLGIGYDPLVIRAHFQQQAFQARADAMPAPPARPRYRP